MVWPWQSVDPETGIVIDTENRVQYGPYLPPNWDSGEFGPLQPVANVVQKGVTSLARIATAQTNDPTAQAPAPTGLWAKITGSAAATGDFVQSTMLKVIVIVVVVAVFALFAMSYVQAKGASLAK